MHDDTTETGLPSLDSPSNALSPEQEAAKSNMFDILRKIEAAAGAPLSDGTLCAALMDNNQGLTLDEAAAMVKDYRMQPNVAVEAPQEVAPEPELPTNQEFPPSPGEMPMPTNGPQFMSKRQANDAMWWAGDDAEPLDDGVPKREVPGNDFTPQGQADDVVNGLEEAQRFIWEAVGEMPNNGLTPDGLEQLFYMLTDEYGFRESIAEEAVKAFLSEMADAYDWGEEMLNEAMQYIPMSYNPGTDDPTQKAHPAYQWMRGNPFDEQAPLPQGGVFANTDMWGNQLPQAPRAPEAEAPALDEMSAWLDSLPESPATYKQLREQVNSYVTAKAHLEEWLRHAFKVRNPNFNAIEKADGLIKQCSTRIAELENAGFEYLNELEQRYQENLDRYELPEYENEPLPMDFDSEPELFVQSLSEDVIADPEMVADLAESHFSKYKLNDEQRHWTMVRVTTFADAVRYANRIKETDEPTEYDGPDEALFG